MKGVNVKKLILIVGLMCTLNVAASESDSRAIDKTFINGNEFTFVPASSTGYSRTLEFTTHFGPFKNQECFTFGAKKVGHTLGSVIFNGLVAKRTDECRYYKGAESEYSLDLLRESSKGGVVYIVVGENPNKLFSFY